MDYGIRVGAEQRWDADLRPRFGELPAFLDGMRALGVRFVEFGTDEDPPRDNLIAYAHACAGAGLRVSLHPYLRRFGPEAFGAGVWPDDLRPFLRLADELGEIAGGPAPLVFHGGMADYKPHYVGLATATANARAFLAWAEEEVRAACPRVRLFCETQLPAEPDDAFVRVGYTYERCMGLVEGTDIGVCWDFGHAFRSVLLGHHAPMPPAEFLRRVGHVHAHDTIPHPEKPARTIDHRALGTGICPWRDYARLLAEAGYAGGILFELPVERYESHEELAEMVRFSVGELDGIFG